MTVKDRRKIALGLIFVPIVVGVAMDCFGSEPIVLHTEGPLLHPTSVTFNIQNFGLVLFPAVVIGIVWLVCSLLCQLFGRRSQEEKDV